MQIVKELIHSYNLLDILKYLLLNTKESDRPELIKTYSNILYNLCDENIPIKHTDRVFTKARLISEAPVEYEFFSTTIKDSFEYNEKEYRNQYKRVELFTDEKLPELLGMYYCDDMFRCEDEVPFVAEVIRKIAKEGKDIKNTPNTRYKYFNKHGYREISLYIKYMEENGLDLQRELADYEPRSPRLTIMRSYLNRFTIDTNFNKWRDGYDTYYWPEVVLDPHFAVYTRFYLEDRELLEYGTGDVEKVDWLRDIYKEIVIKDFYRGFLVSFQNRIVIEYQNDIVNEVVYIDGDEVDVKELYDVTLPDIYVIDSENNKSHIKEYSVHRLLTMPIDIAAGMEKNRAMAHLMFYMTYPERYMRIKQSANLEDVDVMDSEKLEEIDYEMCDKLIQEFVIND